MGDRELVQLAVSQDLEALMYASKEVREDRDVLLMAVKENPRAMSLAPTPKGGIDRKLIDDFVKINGMALAYAPEEHRRDRELLNQATKSRIGTCSGLLWKAGGPRPKEDSELGQEDKPVNLAAT